MGFRHESVMSQVGKKKMKRVRIVTIHVTYHVTAITCDVLWFFILPFFASSWDLAFIVYSWEWAYDYYSTISLSSPRPIGTMWRPVWPENNSHATMHKLVYIIGYVTC